MRIKKQKQKQNLNLRCFLIPLVFVLPWIALADDSMAQPDDTTLQITSERQRELDAIEKEIRDKRRAFETGQPPSGSLNPKGFAKPGALPLPQNSKDLRAGNLDAREAPSLTANPPSNAQGGASENISQKASKGLNRRSSNSRPGKGSFSAPWLEHSVGNSSLLTPSPLQVFSVSKKPVDLEANFTVLPTGSHVKARIVSGVEANAREPYPVLLQLDYAFTGPNKTRIDLSNCFMIAKARANMSTERVMMETESLSCVREDGEHFKRDAKGYVAGNDNTFGATGTYISKQGQVLLAAVLASIAKNAGQAIADAQKTTSILGADKASTASNITGNRAAFIGGSALVDGGAMVAQWYLEQAKELLPSIGVGSGQEVFVVMLDTIKVPTLNEEE